jgi:hypothetical protein
MEWHIDPLLGKGLELNETTAVCNKRINNSVMPPISRQGISKHVPVAMNMNTTIVNVGNGVFYFVRAKWL